MTRGDAALLVEELYRHFLKRAPGLEELADWTNRVVGGLEPLALVRAFAGSPEYARRREVTAMFPAGHYHSPVVDPATVGKAYQSSRSQTEADLNGIDLDLSSMIAFWDASLSTIQATPFREEPQPGLRFFYRGAPYPWGDAITLRAMIAYHRPDRIIEIGSGFSTACMLDTADEFGLDAMHITCIEPYPARLHSLMRPDDYKRVRVITSGVQDVALEYFDQLQAGDILFIDSTHVLKTGSDVHFELFSILPRLRPGVLVHVHDCPFPFEYPEKWVLELNYSWNEAYALRAFLMYNARFSVLFWNGFLARSCRDKIMEDYPDYLRNPGSAIWLITA